MLNVTYSKMLNTAMTKNIVEDTEKSILPSSSRMIQAPFLDPKFGEKKMTNVTDYPACAAIKNSTVGRSVQAVPTIDEANIAAITPI